MSLQIVEMKLYIHVEMASQIVDVKWYSTLESVYGKDMIDHVLIDQLKKVDDVRTIWSGSWMDETKGLTWLTTHDDVIE